MSKKTGVCLELKEHVHEMLFSFAGRAYPDSYFTIYQLDNGQRETRLCPFPTDPNGLFVTDYAAEVVKSLEASGRKLTGFAMFLSEQDQNGIYHWWSLTTDDQVNFNATHFIPFVNEDGVFDYMALAATPKRDEDTAAIGQMLAATDAIWQMAYEHGTADIDIAMTTLEPVAS